MHLGKLGRKVALAIYPSPLILPHYRARIALSYHLQAAPITAVCFSAASLGFRLTTYLQHTGNCFGNTSTTVKAETAATS